MARVLACFALVLAAAPAFAQDLRTGPTLDCAKARLPCNGAFHQLVVEGLKASEGSGLRFQAELCRPLPASEQATCMARGRGEPRSGPSAPPERRAEPARPAPEVGAPTEEPAACDLMGPKSLGTIRAAQEHCPVVTVTIGGKQLVYARAAEAAPKTAKNDAAEIAPQLAPPLATASAEAMFPVVTPETICKQRYPHDYAMRETCVRLQDEAKLAVQALRIDDDVKVLCAKRYVHDWSLYVVCAKQQMTAKLPPSERPDRPKFDIRTKCQRKWPQDFRMEEHCIKEQETAQSEAAGGWIDARIAVHCTDQWPHDWSMFMYCVRNETSAKNRLR
jgi:hypothetical protein